MVDAEGPPLRKAIAPIGGTGRDLEREQRRSSRLGIASDDLDRTYRGRAPLQKVRPGIVINAYELVESFHRRNDALARVETVGVARARSRSKLRFDRPLLQGGLPATLFLVWTARMVH